ncbi:helix-turn-helix protein [compost metagenome]
MGNEMITKEQPRAARGLLDWSQTELAQASNLGESTVRDFEKGRSVPSPNNLAGIKAALKAGGVSFLDDGAIVDGGPGVRLKQ